jgi:hypothetical protein
MDLTTGYPASVRTKLHGIVQLQRTIDKGKALAAGTIGDYHYNCPMDQHVFAFLGIDHDALLEKIKTAKNDQEISDYVAPFIHAKSDAEIEAFNTDWLSHGPDANTEGYFKGMLAELAPERTDITTWADLLDLDEKRPVPVAA